MNGFIDFVRIHKTQIVQKGLIALGVVAGAALAGLVLTKQEDQPDMQIDVVDGDTGEVTNATITSE